MRHASFLTIVVALLGAAAVCAQGTRGARAGPTAGVEDTMAQRMQACVICHGEEGRATREGYFPRIAGKPAGYLYNQLQNFKAGRRRNEAMSHLLQHLSDDYLRDIARHFAELDLAYPAVRATGLTHEQQRMAEKLVFEGVRERDLPACVACHGRQMAGMQPAMPGLLTLPSDYLIAQLGSWRTGQRKAMAPDCMAEVAKRLTPEEVSAVARWLSAQTIDAGTQPAPAAGQPLPMRCGGMER